MEHVAGSDQNNDIIIIIMIIIYDDSPAIPAQGNLRN